VCSRSAHIGIEAPVSSPSCQFGAVALLICPADWVPPVHAGGNKKARVGGLLVVFGRCNYRIMARSVHLLRQKSSHAPRQRINQRPVPTLVCPLIWCRPMPTPVTAADADGGGSLPS